MFAHNIHIKPFTVCLTRSTWDTHNITQNSPQTYGNERKRHKGTKKLGSKTHVPQKTFIHYTLDLLVLMMLSLVIFFIIGLTLQDTNSLSKNIYFVFHVIVLSSAIFFCSWAIYSGINAFNPWDSVPCLALPFNDNPNTTNHVRM